jgi:hypothetical protein
MSLFQPGTRTVADRPTRNWLLETLVVLGILGFGYFAIMLESAPRPLSEATAAEAAN